MPRKSIKKAKREVKQTLSRAENPTAVLEEVAKGIEKEKVEAKEPRVPGKVVHGQKTPWTLKDIEEARADNGDLAFPLCEFTPEDTVKVTWNGVMVQFIAGVSQLMPTCFRDQYLETKRRTRAKKPIMVSTGEIQVDLGAGSLD